MDYKDSALWQRTLGADAQGPEHPYVEQLRGSFEQFRRHVEPLAAEIALSMPGYTDHSVAHCDALWDTAGLICGNDFPVNPAEAFVLGGAFLIHDLAMGLSAYREGLKGIFLSPEWADLLSAEYSDEASALRNTALDDIRRDPTWNGLTSIEVKRCLTIFLREMHARKAEGLLGTEWTLSNKESFYLLPDTELRHWYGEIIGKVARSHWLKVTELADFLPGTLGTPSPFPIEWTVDTVKVACLLRLADASQIDARRAQPLHTPFRLPQGESFAHWAFQERMLHPRCQSSRLEFTASRAFKASEAEAWWLCFDTISMIHQELTSVDSLCADLGKPRMEARGAAGAEDPARFARYVPTDGWTPIDARPHIGHPLSVIEALGGEALYGDDEGVPLREILANAHDASRARMAADPGCAMRPIQLNFDRRDSYDVIEVRDFGIGMSAEDIATYLCDFGTSGWRSAEFRAEYPGALSRGYTTSGQFGIGFFSVFMIAEHVTVVSRPLHGAWIDTHVLEFRGGVTHRPILRQAKAHERLQEPGTLVRLRPNRRLDEELGLLNIGDGVRPATPKEQCDVIRRLALACSYPIEVSALGTDSYEVVLDATPWQRLSADSLYAALHTDQRDYLRQSARPIAEAAFNSSLTELKNSDGVVVGRLGFLRASLADVVQEASCYCGGFEASRIEKLFGLAIGNPANAGRDKVILDVPIESMQEWCRGQWEALSNLPNVSDREMIDFQWFAIGFGVCISDAPFCYHAEGVLTPRELQAMVSTLDCVDIYVDAFCGTVTIEGKQWLNFMGETLIRPTADSFAVGYSQRFEEDEYPILESVHPISESDDEIKVQDSIDKWNARAIDPEDEFIFQVSEAWECKVADVLRHLTWRAVDDDRDGRFSVQGIDGTITRFQGVTLLRPPKV